MGAFTLGFNEFTNRGDEAKGVVTVTDLQDADAPREAALPATEISRTAGTASSGRRPQSGKPGRSRKKPAIVRSPNPLTRETLPTRVFGEDETADVERPVENAADEGAESDDVAADGPAIVSPADATGGEGAASESPIDESTESDSAPSGCDGADGAEVDRSAVDDASGRGAGSAAADELQSLWDLGVEEASQFAVRLRAVAAQWPQDPDPDLRDEAEYLVAQALRTTISHASRLLGDAHKATAHLPRLLGLLEEGALPARWFTFVLRRTTDLTDAHLAEIDESIADWDLRVEEDRFRRQLAALVRWLRDRDDTSASTPERSVDVFPPDDDGTACLQIHGPGPEILALGRRLDSAARAVQQAQRHALTTGEEVPFDDGTVTDHGAAMSLARLRYEILSRSILDTGGIEVPKERFRINVTVPALTLLGVENGPGLLDGIHPLPAAMARELAAGDPTWYRVLTDPTNGAFLPLPATKYTPTREMVEYLRLAFPVCAVPGCTRPTSWASQMDHVEEYDHAHPEEGGRTEVPNLHPLCWRHHQMKTAGILDPVKESIAHPVTNATPAGKTSENEERSGDPPPGESPPAGSQPEISSRAESPGQEVVTGFDPGVTRWTIRGRPPRSIRDECDLITPWITGEFTTRWHQYQERLTAHRDQHSTPEDDAPAPDTEPPPF